MTSNLVDGALALSRVEVGPALAGLHEDQWFERKSARVAPKDLAIAVVALANAEGGTVIVGIHDGSVEGVGREGKRRNDWRQTPLDWTNPPVRARFEEVDVVDEFDKANSVLVARVEPGDHVHELKNGECYLRVGDESRKLTYTQRQELHYDRGSAPYDGEPVRDATMDDLSTPELEAFRRAVGANYGVDELLHARGLLTQKDEVTVGALLLFGVAPQARMPHAHVRVLRYRDVERGLGTGLTQDADGDRRIEGSLPMTIHQSVELIEEWMPKRRALTDSGRFEAVPIVPRDAWLEGLVNAVVHRSYSAAGDHIRVEIFPDRVEIESPGRFPGLVDPNQPHDIRRYARNPRIARVLADLNYARELGEGIKRMIAEMRARGLTDPGYVQTSSTVRLTLTGVSRLSSDVLGRLPAGALSVLDLLRAGRRPLGTGDVIEATGLSRPTVKKYLNALRSEGLIVWRGKSANDPRATWSVNTS